MIVFSASGWDIEIRLKEIPQESCLGIVKTNVETILDAVKGASSISAVNGALTYETKLVCNINGKMLNIDVVTPQGSAKSDIILDESNVEKLSINLNSKYTIEILELIKTGFVTIQIWEDFIILRSFGDKCISVIPTIN